VCKISLTQGVFSETGAGESINVEPTVWDEATEEREENHEERFQGDCPIAGYCIWDGGQGESDIVYIKVQKLLEWEKLALLAQRGTSDEL
jgi:hypothetical protein